MGTSVEIGTTPSTSGALRLATASAINFRNAANGGNQTHLSKPTINTVADCTRVGEDGAGVLFTARTGGVAPVAADLPAGQCCVWDDGTTVSIWYNDAGTLKSVALT